MEENLLTARAHDHTIGKEKPNKNVHVIYNNFKQKITTLNIPLARIQMVLLPTLIESFSH